LVELRRKKETLTAIQDDKHKERISLETFFALAVSDSEKPYNYIDGYAHMVLC